ncbi:MAG: DUF4293 domain-containing protein [Saprospiraceae bacterium]|nr:DUF4293 domain-containing protein [Saprospiraceae bacterium]
MIQRIQTIWLTLSAFCFLGLWAPSLSVVKTTSASAGVFSDLILYANESMSILIGSGVTGILVFISIFLYKERTFQILLSAGSSLLHLILCVGSPFLLLSKSNKLNEFVPDTGLFLSMAGIVLIWLATRAIRRDEALVKSMDRLR